MSIATFQGSGGRIHSAGCLVDPGWRIYEGGTGLVKPLNTRGQRSQSRDPPCRQRAKTFFTSWMTCEMMSGDLTTVSACQCSSIST